MFHGILNSSSFSLFLLHSHLPSTLSAFINKSLEKDRNLRYQHAADIRADLQRLKRDTESGRVVAVGPEAVVAAQEPAPGWAAQLPPRHASSAAVPAAASSSAVPAVAAPMPAAHKTRFWKIPAIAAVVLAILVAGGLFWRHRSMNAFTETD